MSVPELVYPDDGVGDLDVSCSDSGIGDFGIKGLEDFVETHCCTQTCEKMDLSQVMLEELLEEVLNQEKTPTSPS